MQVLGLFGVRHKPGRPFLFGKRGLVVGRHIELLKKAANASSGKDLDFGWVSYQGSVRTIDSILEHTVLYIGHVVQLVRTVNPSGSTPL